MLRIDQGNRFSSGKIVHIEKTIVEPSINNPFTFNGSISIYSLRRNLLVSSSINDGYITAFHRPNVAARAPEAIIYIEALPEVIIVSSPGSGGSWSNSTLYSLQSFMNSSSLPGSANYSYSNPNSTGGSSGSGSSGGSPSSSSGGGNDIPLHDQPIRVDFENETYLPPIDLNAYLKCFTAIPDAGATCSIRIFSDIPSDAHPNRFFNFETGSPGHAFLQIKKTNGTQSIQQNIGFYPVQGWKLGLTTAPVKGKFVDNAGHEFNASLEMDLTPEQLQRTIINMQRLARFINYDIDEYNCTDFALEVFNYTRSNKLVIPLYDIPGGAAPQGTATPQGLFSAISTLKNTSVTEASKISIPGVKGFTGNSHGPCN